LNSGDVLDDVWTALIELEAGEISRQPVRTEYGWHVLRLDHRADGARLPFEHVREHISARLEARAWTLEAARFVDGLLLQSTSHPCLKLTAEATLDDGESETTRAADLLGAALADEVMALESLTEHGRERVAADAKRRGEPPERVLTQAIGTFLTSADDEGWTSLISRLRDSDTPLADCLDLIVVHQLPPITAKRTLILTPGGRGGAPELKGQSNGTGK
jgi:peptidyl-prolyl cis-trans isomerase C